MTRLMDELTKPERIFPVFRTLSRSAVTSRVLTRAMAPFSPFDSRRHSDPYPLYDELRSRGPVFDHRRAGVWLVSGRAECEEVLRGPVSVDRSELMRVLAPYKNLRPETFELMNSMMLLRDPPDHTRLRKLVSRAFTPRTVGRLEPEVVRVTSDLLDDLERDPTVDIMAAYADQLPIYLIGRMLGLPRELWPRLKELSDVIAQFVDPLSGFRHDEMDRAIAELCVLLDTEIENRRTAPTDDLISGLVTASDGDDRLDQTELQSMIILLMVAGHETTSGLIGNALVALDRDRPARRQLIARPELTDNAVEELIRFDSPVQTTDRFLTEDLAIDGQTIPRGANVVTLLGAANRDPRIHDRPNQLLLDRAEPQPLSFGHGIHYCLGASLARLEAKVAIPAFLARFPDYRVIEDRLSWKRSMTLRGPSRLLIDPGP